MRHAGQVFPRGFGSQFGSQRRHPMTVAHDRNRRFPAALLVPGHDPHAHSVRYRSKGATADEQQLGISETFSKTGAYRPILRAWQDSNLRPTA